MSLTRHRGALWEHPFLSNCTGFALLFIIKIGLNWGHAFWEVLTGLWPTHVPNQYQPLLFLTRPHFMVDVFARGAAGRGNFLTNIMYYADSSIYRIIRSEQALASKLDTQLFTCGQLDLIFSCPQLNSGLKP